GGRRVGGGVIARAALVLPYPTMRSTRGPADRISLMYTGSRRKTMRAPGFDYRDPGPYYVTICTEFRVHRFGTVADGQTNLNDAGVMIDAVWRSISRVFPGVTLDAYVLMPNHLHGVLTLAIPEEGSLDGEASLSRVLQWFKTETTNRYIRGVKRLGWDP